MMDTKSRDEVRCVVFWPSYFIERFEVYEMCVLLGRVLRENFLGTIWRASGSREDSCTDRKGRQFALGFRSAFHIIRRTSIFRVRREFNDDNLSSVPLMRRSPSTRRLSTSFVLPMVPIRARPTLKRRIGVSLFQSFPALFIFLAFVQKLGWTSLNDFPICLW